MRIAISISYTKNWKELAEITIPNTAEYCLRHEYSLFVTVEEEYKKYTGLEKLNNLRTLLPYFDVVLSMDCDCLITNLQTSIESFTTDSQSLFLCKGMNMGVFIMRNTIWSFKLVNSMINLIREDKYSCEQDALTIIPIGHEEVCVLNHPAFNSYLSELYPEIPQPVTAEQGQWEPGQFICHFPALSMETRAAKMNDIKNKTIR